MQKNGIVQGKGYFWFATDLMPFAALFRLLMSAVGFSVRQ